MVSYSAADENLISLCFSKFILDEPVGITPHDSYVKLNNLFK